MAAYVGIIERPRDRSGHSLYCSYVYINKAGEIGDGAGLVTHRLDEFTVGGLNCWENWMPLARAALYGQGEDLHIACWPAALGDMPANGGSCVAAPDGSWVLPPLHGETGIRYCKLDPAKVREERQNFDPAGHYSRPSVTQLHVNRERQSTVKFTD